MRKPRASCLTVPYLAKYLARQTFESKLTRSLLPPDSALYRYPPFLLPFSTTSVDFDPLRELLLAQLTPSQSSSSAEST